MYVYVCLTVFVCMHKCLYLYECACMCLFLCFTSIAINLGSYKICKNRKNEKYSAIICSL